MGRVHAELGEPDVAAAADVVGLGDVALQIAKGKRAGVPGDGDEVDGAAGAVAEELGEPGEAAAVGDGRGAEFEVAVGAIGGGP